jgi:hypothetical protein
MEEFFKRIASHIAFGVEVIAALIIAYGAAEAVIGLLRQTRLWSHGGRKLVWHRFGRYCADGDFADLGADRATGRDCDHPDIPQLFPGEGY